MSHISVSHDDSLGVPILIVTVHSTFTMDHLAAVIGRVTREFDAMNGPFYYINAVEPFDMTVDEGTDLFANFQDGGILTYPQLQGIVVVNAHGFVRVVRQYVDKFVDLDKPLAEAATLDEAFGIIEQWSSPL